MELSDEDIVLLARPIGGLFDDLAVHYQSEDIVKLGRTVEAEVRKGDTELIRQLVEALEGVKALNMGGELALWTAEFDRLLSAIAAARARMSSPPTA